MKLSVGTPELSVILPSYNEARTIEKSLLRLEGVLKEIGKPFEIILVIDGQVDRTAELVEALNLSSLKVIQIEKNHGKGYALKTGIDSARGTKYVAYIDADMDINPIVIKESVHALDNNQSLVLCLGSKIHPNSEIIYPLHRRFLSRGFSTLIKFLFRLNVTDTQTGFKCSRPKQIKGIAREVVADDFTFDLELIVRFHKESLQMQEVPVEINYDFTSSINFSSIFTMFAAAMRIKYRSIRN